MKSCVKVFAAKGTGAGTQVVTGIVDSADGLSFVPKAFVFLFGFANNDTLTANTGFSDSYALGAGVDDITNAGATMKADNPQFGANKSVTTNDGVGYSVLDCIANAFFGGDKERSAYVSAVASGQFTLTYTLNLRTGDYIAVLVLGGSDLDLTVNNTISNQTVTTPSIPKAVLTLPISVVGAHATSNGVGAGGGSSPFGFDTRVGIRGCAGMATQTNSGSSRFANSDRMSALFSETTLDATAPKVTTWGPLSYAITGASSSIGAAQLAFSGATISANAGQFAVPGSSQSLYVDLGIQADLVFLFSNGKALSASLATDKGETCVAIISGHAAAGMRQVSFWTAERSPWAGTATVPGARWLSSTSALRFGTPDGSTTTIQMVGAAVVSNNRRILRLDFSSADGVARDVQFLAIGGVQTTPTTHHSVIRRLRRFPLPFDRAAFMFINRLELIMNTGVGLVSGQGEDPQVAVRFSPDNGYTWGNWIYLSMGKRGDYDLRAAFHNVGMVAQGACEIVVADPVVAYLIDCLIDYDVSED